MAKGSLTFLSLNNLLGAIYALAKYLFFPLTSSGFERLNLIKEGFKKSTQYKLLI